MSYNGRNNIKTLGGGVLFDNLTRKRKKRIFLHISLLSPPFILVPT